MWGFSKEYCRRVKILFAESYSQEEVAQQFKRWKKTEELRLFAIKLFYSGNVEKAIDTALESYKQYSRGLISRNNRILNTVAAEMADLGEPALLVVGSAHRNLMRMFVESDYDSVVVKEIAMEVLPMQDEKVSRGWQSSTKYNERGMAATHLLRDILAREYQIRGFDSNGNLNVSPRVQAGIYSKNDYWMLLHMIQDALLPFSTKNIWNVHRQVSTGSPFPEILASINLPTTQNELERRIQELGYKNCN